MRDSHVKWLSSFHKILYRTTGGRVGHRLVDNDMLLLTTTGKGTSSQHTVPLLYLSDGNDLIVIASYGGRTDHPQWYRNLLSEPAVSVQILDETTTFVAITMDPRERGVWWPRVVAAYSDYAVYQSRTEREIPLVRLTRHG